MQPCGNGGPGDPDSPIKNSGHFIHFYLLKQSNFSSVWHGPSPGGLLLSIQAPKWAALILTNVLNIVSQYHIYVSHIKIPPEHASVQCFRSRHA